MKTPAKRNSPNRCTASAANDRSPGGLRSEQLLQTALTFSIIPLNRRPPRRSSGLLPKRVVTFTHLSPAQENSVESSGSPSLTDAASMLLIDTLLKLYPEEHAGSPLTEGVRTPTRVETGAGVARRDPAEGKSKRGISSDSSLKPNNSSTLSSSDQMSDAPRTVFRRPPSCSVKTLKTTPDRKRSLDRTVWMAASSNLKEDVREKKRQRWREFEKKKAVPHLRPKKHKLSPAEPSEYGQNPETRLEPVVLSEDEEESEEEEESEDDGDDGDRAMGTSQSCSSLRDLEKKQGQQAGKPVCDSTDDEGVDWPLTRIPSAFLQLEFTSLHDGLTHSEANGKITITKYGITLPVKGVKEGKLSIVASEVRGYGLWDGGVAQDGTLLAGWKGPAPLLLFLWVTNAQANLLRRELSAIHCFTFSGPFCSLLLLVLKEQLQEFQEAVLASILDTEEYRRGYSGGPTSPLDWTDGLLLLQSCPPPLDQYLLRLLGQSAQTSSQVRSSERNKKWRLSSAGLQQLPTRLIQYPAAPCKGQISVTKEDLACLDDGEFLNDVIIDFYLKYLLLEGVGGSVAERSHVFSSFFYKQLSRRRAAGEDDCVPDCHMRHQRVKTWTRHVDIFAKDFLFVPVNQGAHWFLVMICFPSREKVRYEVFHSRAGRSERAAGKPNLSLRPQPPPPPVVTQEGWQNDTVLNRPCILIMDSMKMTHDESIARLLRDYLQEEWQVRRGTPRLFTFYNFRSNTCRVPQQDNCSDCGLYLLQYVESFLQNPIVHFAFPVNLGGWFPRQRVNRKRQEIRSLIMKMHKSQQHL
ncbi:sentrin-specific protease 7b [Toxotes jaculatrix]|uniref:sentrin-specific protease 7b n=1 Tax=Toxotes jaculatrix TaxID=941984 RepID=UPI001B3A9247|nr:sentrin-specific protease 7b [Toxotes jaculatrix]